jgi:RNase P/RNase MRP subunit p29
MDVRTDLALAGEILGSPFTVLKAPGFAHLPVSGTLVDETLHTFLLRSPDGTKTWRVPKSGLEGTLLLGGRELPLRGDTLRFRLEDRTKRLAWRGRRGVP